MRLLLKLNLVLLLTFGAGVAISSYVSRGFLQRSARQQVTQQARLMMEAAGAMRTYTAQQISPLLLAQRALMRTTFPPQIVAAYGAEEIFANLRANHPDYTYKEAALNPTNLKNRASDWEADVIGAFRNHAEMTEITGQRQTPEGPSFFLAHPIKVDPPCLQCHSTPAAAPPAMLKSYGRDHGFNWKAGETIGAQIVSVPTALSDSVAERAFQSLLASLGGAALATFLVLELFIAMVVIRPVTRLSAMAEEISKGTLNVPDLQVRGGDEIALLARAFNRMCRSLEKAIQLLESK
jgi:HAMP domain-containing protein